MSIDKTLCGTPNNNLKKTYINIGEPVYVNVYNLVSFIKEYVSI